MQREIVFRFCQLVGVLPEKERMAILEEVGRACFGSTPGAYLLSSQVSQSEAFSMVNKRYLSDLGTEESIAWCCLTISTHLGKLRSVLADRAWPVEAAEEGAIVESKIAAAFDSFAIAVFLMMGLNADEKAP